MDCPLFEFNVEVRLPLSSCLARPEDNNYLLCSPVRLGRAEEPNDCPLFVFDVEVCHPLFSVCFGRAKEQYLSLYSSLM